MKSSQSSFSGDAEVWPVSWGEKGRAFPCSTQVSEDARLCTAPGLVLPQRPACTLASPQGGTKTTSLKLLVLSAYSLLQFRGWILLRIHPLSAQLVPCQAHCSWFIYLLNRAGLAVEALQHIINQRLDPVLSSAKNKLGSEWVLAG